MSKKQALHLLHIPPTSLPLRASRYSWGPTGTSEHLWGINRLHFSSPTRPKLQPTSLWLATGVPFDAMPADSTSPNRMAKRSDEKGVEEKEKREKRKRNDCAFIIPLLNPRVIPLYRCGANSMRACSRCLSLVPVCIG